ncbi:hypothetical protein Q6250_28465, partial [Klebsiella pneumoniae]
MILKVGIQCAFKAFDRKGLYQVVEDSEAYAATNNVGIVVAGQYHPIDTGITNPGLAKRINAIPSP